jgi:hypothetical protein
VESAKQAVTVAQALSKAKAARDGTLVALRRSAPLGAGRKGALGKCVLGSSSWTAVPQLLEVQARESELQRCRRKRDDNHSTWSTEARVEKSPPKPTSEPK